MILHALNHIHCSILTTVFLLCFSNNSFAAPSDEFITGSGTLIAFQKFDHGYHALLQYLKYTDRTICYYLKNPRRTQNINCKIYVTAENIPGDISTQSSGNSLIINVSSNTLARGRDFQLMGKLINALLYAKSGIFPEKTARPLPGWLITGIYAKIQAHFLEQSIISVSYYPGLRALLQDGKIPPLRRSLFTALSPEQDGIAFDLYLELCRFFINELRRLSSSVDNPFSDLVILSSKERYKPEEIFDSTVLRVISQVYDKTAGNNVISDISDEEKLQLWFIAALNKRLVNYLVPLKAAAFISKFRKFRKVNYRIEKRKKTIHNQIDIVDFPRVYHKLLKDNYAQGLLAEKLIELNSLSNIAPALTREPLAVLYNTLKQINSIAAPVALDRMRRAMRQLTTAISRQAAIEKYLLKIEYQMIPPGRLFRKELLETKRLQKNNWTELSKYLDKVEADYLED
ncbi:hypothetical protein P0136_06245 [Lentisphaerota bacterium ZTH]|nr:hypothetical protein JYG24_02645 [Lentisphaerota bacterium]WET07590.1 hypothetical protein P0136_06245 [Lentisphaerota bacterium ZTH]